MEKNAKHNTTSTTLKVDAGYKKYHCGFFCQRKTSSDVVDPKDTKPALSPPFPQKVDNNIRY